MTPAYTVKVDYLDGSGHRRFTVYGVRADSRETADIAAREMAPIEKAAEGQGRIRIQRTKIWGDDEL